MPSDTRGRPPRLVGIWDGTGSPPLVGFSGSRVGSFQFQGLVSSYQMSSSFQDFTSDSPHPKPWAPQLQFRHCCPHTRTHPLTGWHPNTHTRSPAVVLQGFGSPNLVPTPKIRKSTQTRLPSGSSVPIATAPRTRVALPARRPGRTRDVTAPLSGG